MSSVRTRFKSFLIGDITALENTPLVSGNMNASITGPVVNIEKADTVAIQVDWASSDCVGTIVVNVSIDQVNWEALTFSPALAQPNSDSAGYMINLALIPAPYIRVDYIKTSGSNGQLTVSMFAKGA